jgi:hypothetical protein
MHDESQQFFGSGDSVPFVDAVDLEAVWQVGCVLSKRATGVGVFRAACRPSAMSALYCSA